MQNYAMAGKGTGALSDALGLGGAEGNARATQGFWNNPAIQSQLDIGSQNVLRNQAATGQLNSGKTNVDLQNLGQQVASQGWNNYLQQLQPFLNASQNAASGIGGMYSGLGSQMNQSYGNQGNAAYGAQTSIGNANANADLAQINANANIWGGLTGLAKLGTSSIPGNSIFGKFLGFAEGGDPPVGEPIIVGERGPEVFVPDRRGTVVPHEAVDWSRRDPEAAYRQSLDRWRTIRDNPGAVLSNFGAVGSVVGPAIENADMGRPAQRGMSPMGPTQRPDTATMMRPRPPVSYASQLMDMLGPSSAQAAEAPPDPEPMRAPEHQKALADIDAEISKRYAAVDAAKRRYFGQDERITRETQRPLGEIARLEAQKSGLEAPYLAQRDAWQRRQDDMAAERNRTTLQGEARSKRAAVPFQEKYPELNENIQKYSMGGAGALGLLAGLTGKGKLLKPVATGAGFGGLEGALTAAGPSMTDAGYLPYGSKPQQDAAGRLVDPGFLGSKVAPEAALNAGIGALGAYTGSKIPVVAKATGGLARNLVKWLENPSGARAVKAAEEVPVKAAAKAVEEAPAKAAKATRKRAPKKSEAIDTAAEEAAASLPAPTNIGPRRMMQPDR